jgi:hypothetical protein
MVLFLVSVKGQSQNDLFIDAIPPSPSQAALAEYTDIPLNLSKGQHTYQVSLAEESSPFLKVPINLLYNASGVKVDQESSIVGLGWSLSLGGSVSMTLNGLDDFSSNGYASLIQDYQQAPDPNNPEDYQTLVNIAEGIIDSQPDLFNFQTADGLNGKFVKGLNGFNTFPVQDVDITKVTNGFEIKNSQGVKYTFTAKEITLNSGVGYRESYTSAYNLTSIVHPSGDHIDFNYLSAETIVYNTRINYSRSVDDCEGNTTSVNGSTSSTQVRLLSSINFHNGSIHLSYSPREDLQGGKKLDQIEIKDVSGMVVRRIQFFYDYFHANTSSNDFVDKRLKLTNLILNNEKQYSFDYNNGLPSKLSLERDHWGYYNNNGASTLLPSLEASQVESIGIQYPQFQGYQGANRSVDPNFSDAGILSQITFPTGGTAKFEYESNDYGYIGSTPIMDSTFSSEDILSLSGSYNLGDRTQVSNAVTIWAESYKKLKLHVSISYPDNSPVIDGNPFSCQCAKVQLLDFNDNIVESYDSPSESGTYDLTGLSGIYKIRVISRVNGSVVSGRLERIYFDPLYDVINKYRLGGGLRLKKLTLSDDSDPFNDIVKEFKYRDVDDPERSSGVIARFPNYISHSYFIKALPTEESTPPFPDLECPVEQCDIIVVASTDNAFGVGTEVEYRNVSTLFNGTSSAAFTSQYTFPDIVFSGPPVLVQDRSYRRGLPISQEVMSEDESYARVSNTYQYSNTRVPEYVSGWKVQMINHPCGTDEYDADFERNHEFQIANFTYVFDTYLLTNENRTSRDENGITLEIDISKEYSEFHNLPIAIETTIGQNELLRSELVYPLDVANPSGEVLDLIVNHMIGSLIEKRINVLRSQNSFPLFLQQHFYETLSNGDVVISQIDISKTGYESDKFTAVEYDYFDDDNASVKNSLIKRIIPINGVESNYLWGYDGAFPISDLKNVDYNTVVAGLSSNQLSTLQDKNVTSEELFSSFENLTNQYPQSMPKVYSYSTINGIIGILDPNLNSAEFEYKLGGELTHVFVNNDLSIQYKYDFINSPRSQTQYTSKIEGLMDLETEYDKEYVNEDITYVDGLGRVNQTVQREASYHVGGNSLDIVSLNEYEADGLMHYSFLPFVNNSTNGQFVNNAQEIQNSFYNPSLPTSLNQYVSKSLYPYAQTIYEKNPQQRPIEIGQPGAVWQPIDPTNQDPEVLGRTGKLNYRFNTDLYESVVKYVYFNDQLEVSQYSNGELEVIESIDENDHSTFEYKDRQGHVVLKKQQLAENEFAETYYVYGFNNLLYIVIPPELSKQLNGVAPTASQLNQWAFQYKYDKRRRMVYKRLPGAEPMYMIYDSRDRLVLSQDGNQRLNNQWTFTKYDALNRPIANGFYIDPVNESIDDMHAAVDLFYSSGSAPQMYELKGGTIHGYTNLSFPDVSNENDYLTITHYDSYDYQFQDCSSCVFDGTLSWQRILQHGTYSYPTFSNANVLGQVTYNKSKVLVSGATHWIKTANYYDDRYRIIQSFSSNDYLQSTSRTSMLYNFPGWMLEARNIHYKEGQPIREIHKQYDYDQRGRVLSGYHELFVEGVSKGRVKLAENEFNALGELVEKNLHVDGTNSLQSVDYRYNIRGWLQSINKTSLLQDTEINSNDPIQDYFGMNLFYNEVVSGIPSTN